MADTKRYASVPVLTLADDLSSSGAYIKTTTANDWGGNALTTADFNTDYIPATIINDAKTLIEFILIDATTIGNLTTTGALIYKRGLKYYAEGDTTDSDEVTANKLAWTQGESKLLIGTNPPWMYGKFPSKENDETITGLWTFPASGSANVAVVASATNPPLLDAEFATKKYVDDTAIAGAPDATTGVKGIVEIATQAEVDAGTTTGGTGASVVVRPPELANVIQDGSYVYAADSVGTDSYAITLVPAITAYVTGQVFHFKAGTANTGASTLNVNGLGAKAIKVNGNALETGAITTSSPVTVIYDGTDFQMISVSASTPSSSVLSQLNKFTSSILPPGAITLTAGEAINGTTTPVAVYQKNSDAKVYKADATYLDETSNNFLGFVISNVNTNDSVVVYTEGILTIPSQTLTSATSSTVDQMCDSAPNSILLSFNDTNDKFSQGFCVGPYIGNISSIAINLNVNTSVGATTTISLYAMDKATGKPTGAALATSDTIAVTTAEKTYTFTPAYTVYPEEYYCFVLNVTAITSGSFGIRGTDSSLSNGFGYRVLGISDLDYKSTDGGSTWDVTQDGTYFKTYSTLRRVPTGAPAYLSETSGEFTLTQPTGTTVAQIKVGKLLSSTSLSIGWNSKIEASGVASGVGSSSTGSHAETVFIHMPNNATEVFVYSWDNKGTDDYGEAVLFKNSLSSVTNKATGTQTYSLENGVLKVVGTTSSEANTLTATAIFKS